MQAVTVDRSDLVPKNCYVDEYGQIQLEYKWYRFNSWQPRYKMGSYGLALSVAGCWMHSKFNRRPFYANLPIKVGTIILGTGVWYLYGLYLVEKKWIRRDATINHYIDLHPDDFDRIRSAGRKYGDILMGWQPYRAYEKTVPFLSGKRPAYTVEPRLPPADPEPKAE